MYAMILQEFLTREFSTLFYLIPPHLDVKKKNQIFQNIKSATCVRNNEDPRNELFQTFFMSTL